MKHEDFLRLVPFCTREQLEACATAKPPSVVETILQARYEDLCDGNPLPRDLQLVILEAVHSRRKRDVLELLRTAVKWKSDGELNEAIDICREAVQRDPTILWSRKLLEKLENLKSDPDSAKAEERLVARPQPPAIHAPSGNSEPDSKPSSGCLSVMILVLLVAAAFFGGIAVLVSGASKKQIPVAQQ